MEEAIFSVGIFIVFYCIMDDSNMNSLPLSGVLSKSLNTLGDFDNDSMLDTSPENSMQLDTSTENSMQLDTSPENSILLDTSRENSMLLGTTRENSMQLDTSPENRMPLQTSSQSAQPQSTDKGDGRDYVAELLSAQKEVSLIHSCVTTVI